MKKLTCVGARATPLDVQNQMTDLGRVLSEQGWIGRSGHANGADLAFEAGFAGNFEIYLPWKNFNADHPLLGNSFIFDGAPAALQIAESLHPAWDKCSYGVKKLHGRNIYQVLGKNLDEPSTALICWTPGGKTVGGTATAINLAGRYNIPVFNLANSTPEEIVASLNLLIEKKLSNES